MELNNKSPDQDLKVSDMKGECRRERERERGGGGGGGGKGKREGDHMHVWKVGTCSVI